LKKLFVKHEKEYLIESYYLAFTKFYIQLNKIFFRQLIFSTILEFHNLSLETTLDVFSLISSLFAVLNYILFYLV